MDVPRTDASTWPRGSLENLGSQRDLNGRRISTVALGGATWSVAFADGQVVDPDESSAVSTIHAAIDAGIRLIDTARAYTTSTDVGHSESLIARALASHDEGDTVLVATKGGHWREGDNFPISGAPDVIYRHCELSLTCLNVDRLDLYQLHWPDPDVPFKKTLDAFVKLKERGLIREIGVSNVTLDQVKEADQTAGIASVQNPFSPFTHEHWRVLDYCTERRITYLVYSPLRGLAMGHPTATRLSDCFPAAAKVALDRDLPLEQILLGWLLSLSNQLVPICGASRPQSARVCANAHTSLAASDIARL